LAFPLKASSIVDCHSPSSPGSCLRCVLLDRVAAMFFRIVRSRSSASHHHCRCGLPRRVLEIERCRHLLDQQRPPPCPLDCHCPTLCSLASPSRSIYCSDLLQRVATASILLRHSSRDWRSLSNLFWLDLESSLFSWFGWIRLGSAFFQSA
jgi:hypothetical protein